MSILEAYEGVIEHHDQNGDEDYAQCVFEEFQEWFHASEGECPFHVLTLPRLKKYAENNETI